MMKPGKTFRMNSTTKALLSTIVDPVARNSFKRAMIDAQLCSEVIVKREPRGDKNAPRGNAGSGTGYTNTGNAATPNA